VVRGLDEGEIVLDDVGLRRPTLDDVFLSITGRATHQSPGDVVAGD
jgi:ABC-2 type transport system ATP-binding protein